MRVWTSSSVGNGFSPPAILTPTASSPRSSVLLSSSVSTLAPQSATAHALERRTSYGQSRKSTPMELLSASNSGVGPAPKRPPHSLWDFTPIIGSTPRSVTGILRLRDPSDRDEVVSRIRRGQGATGGNELLVFDGTYTCRKGEQSDEARCVALLVDIVFAEGDEALVVQRVVALAADDL